jgi:hypothetical protein
MRDVVVVLEFKAGATKFEHPDRWQAEQYALDLRDFHAGCRDTYIAPILICTDASESLHVTMGLDPNRRVQDVACVMPGDLATHLVSLVEGLSKTQTVLGADWELAPYRPTPGIVEAALRVYEDHDVRDISSADATNLDLTVEALIEIAERCRRHGKKGIAFITGSPGSGKTLAGLQLVHDRRLAGDEETDGVFLSGNMPLVEVVSHHLAHSRPRSERKEAARRIKARIQHAYLFRNEYGEHPERRPYEHIVLFDEAQRAWDSKRVTSWTRGSSTRSEPQMLLDVMDRHPDWALIVCIVGGGQEINSGEAGLGEWGRALEHCSKDWEVWASPHTLPGLPEPPGGRLFDAVPSDGITLHEDRRLHLSMNTRSPRAERLNAWVEKMLDGNSQQASQLVVIQREYPMVLTRDLGKARWWLRARTEHDQRCGLVASADARRLLHWGLDTRAMKRDKSWPQWFLSEMGDVRSSHQLETVATNFDCQGLELDWVGVCWGSDLTIDTASGGWRKRVFRGAKWNTAGEEKSRFMLNSYRVLLTRARRGQVIWIPKPDGTDPTLVPEYLDATADYLMSCGIPLLDDLQI